MGEQMKTLTTRELYRLLFLFRKLISFCPTKKHDVNKFEEILNELKNRVEMK